jgi:hypothetical protein
MMVTAGDATAAVCESSEKEMRQPLRMRAPEGNKLFTIWLQIHGFVALLQFWESCPLSNIK